MARLKYIFVVGGVMSGVGKGIASASIGAILKSRGFKISAVKIDPYVNVDAGTMNPIEHGEVFVLDDGTECDQDLGNYERFLDTNLSASHYMTTGLVYKSVIDRERNLEYGGRCVEVVPHIPMEVIDRINKAAKTSGAEIIITEIGGTVGEYQNILFLEAIRMLKTKNPKDILLVLVSYLPFQGEDFELKTKPTQHAVKMLNSAGLQPNIVIARAGRQIDKKRKEKIAFNCGMEEQDVISAPDVKNIYDIPLNFEKDRMSDRILKRLGLRPKFSDFKNFKKLNRIINNLKDTVRIGIVGKYFGSGGFILADSYVSVIEAIKHAAYFLKYKPEIEWLNAESFDDLSGFDGIIVPGGFGSRGVEGKIKAIREAREKKIPYLGLCYGMQLAIVEASRSLVHLQKANTTEVDSKTPYPVIDILPEQRENILKSNYGATMRLGAYPAHLEKNTIAFNAYKKTMISERHRHRYEVNPEYIEELKKTGIIFSGFSPDRRLMEIMEFPMSVHPFFVATQFHPELKSRPFHPHPLFKAFVKASINKKTHV